VACRTWARTQELQLKWERIGKGALQDLGKDTGAAVKVGAH